MSEWYIVQKESQKEEIDYAKSQNLSTFSVI